MEDISFEFAPTTQVALQLIDPEILQNFQEMVLKQEESSQSIILPLFHLYRICFGMDPREHTWEQFSAFVTENFKPEKMEDIRNPLK